MKRLQSIKALVLVVVLAAAGALGVHNVSAASVGQIYVSPASASVQAGSNVTVSVRVNPGAAIDSAQFTLTYDAAKLKYVSMDVSQSPFSIHAQQTVSGNTITVVQANIGSITSDSLIAAVTLQALSTSTSGSTSLTLSDTQAELAGQPNNPSAVNGIVNFQAPPASGGSSGGGSSGSTGAGSSSGSGSSSSGASGGSTSAAAGSGSSTSSSSGAPATTPPQIVPENGSVVGTVSSQFTVASINFKTNVPTQAYIKYGLDNKLNLSTPLSGLDTSHAVSLDPALLIPGTTYYYQVVIKDAAGNQVATQIKSFTTKGYTLHVTVTDKNGHPLANTSVELHSTPQTVKTDGDGVATFTDVAPGDHHVVYTSGGKQFTQPVTVSDSVKTDKNSGTQSAAVQNFSVQFATSSSNIGMILPIVFIGLMIVVALVLYLRGRFSPMQMAHGYAAASIAQPASIATPATDVTTGGNAGSVRTGVSIERAHGIQAPHPGSVIAPVEHDEDK